MTKGNVKYNDILFDFCLAPSTRRLLITATGAPAFYVYTLPCSMSEGDWETIDHAAICQWPVPLLLFRFSRVNLWVQVSQKTYKALPRTSYYRASPSVPYSFLNLLTRCACTSGPFQSSSISSSHLICCLIPISLMLFTPSGSRMHISSPRPGDGVSPAIPLTMPNNELANSASRSTRTKPLGYP